MSEATEYAEMLEIPAATINVERRKRRRRDVKGEALGAVNERLAAVKAPAFHDDKYAGNEYSAPAPRQEEVPPQKQSPVFLAEVGVACALLVGIFLTNVFVPNSAINTFIRSTFETKPVETSRSYRDFELSAVVSELTDCTVEVSENGVLSFTSACSVYPAIEGTVTDVSGERGALTVTVEHAPNFYSVFTGLSEVYSATGDKVLKNVPLGYSGGEGEVTVSFFEGGQLLKDYSVGAKNCLTWTDGN